MNADEQKRFLAMVIAFFSAFFLSLFLLLELRPGMLEPLRNVLWTAQAVSMLFGASFLGLGAGIILLMPSRTGEYEEYGLGVALLFFGSVTLSIALAILLDLVGV